MTDIEIITETFPHIAEEGEIYQLIQIALLKARQDQILIDSERSSQLINEAFNPIDKQYIS